MKNLYTLLLLTLSLFAENFSSNIIMNSVIINSTIDSSSNIGGSGQLISQHIQTKIFDQINIDIPAKLMINQGKHSDIILKTESNVLKSLDFYVKNSTLFIQAKENFSTTKGVMITITTPHLKRLVTESAVDINIKGYNEEYFDLEVDGTGDFLFSSGRFRRLSLHADGSYDIDLIGMRVDEATIVAEGSGDIKLSVTRYLKVDLKDTVEVKYRGDPKVNKKISDVADLTHI
jgi:hypothetical protein